MHTKNKIRISAIVAMSLNRVIGKNNQLPWKISEDLKRFKTITTGHPIVMGRKTFESIGRVLPHRENIIISRQMGYRVEGAQVVQSLEGALELCKGKTDEVFIIGGAEIYRLALSQTDRLYLTLIHQEIEGDAFFPEFARSEFTEVSREDHQDPIPYSFLVLDRRKT